MLQIFNFHLLLEVRRGKFQFQLLKGHPNLPMLLANKGKYSPPQVALTNY